MENKLEVLRERLNKLMVDNDAEFDKIYSISLEIDTQVVYFYKKVNFVEVKKPKKAAV